MTSLIKRTGFWMTVTFAALGMVLGCGIRNDVDFARTAFSRLANGLYLARPMIDWNSLKMLEEDIGAKYRALPNDKEHENFERSFIDGFKNSFRAQRANVNMFKGWRLLNTPDPRLRIVAVDAPASKTILLFTIVKTSGKPLLTEIKALQANDLAALEAFEREHHLGLLKGR